jgi:hypothetical protein
VAFVFLFSLAKQGKKEAKNPHSEAMRKRGKKNTSGSPHLLIFLFSVFRVHFVRF